MQNVSNVPVGTLEAIFSRRLKVGALQERSVPVGTHRHYVPVGTHRRNVPVGTHRRNVPVGTLELWERSGVESWP